MNILVIDKGGLFTDQAANLAKGKDKIFYYTEWGRAFPNLQDFAAGTGYENIIKVKRLKIDCNIEDMDLIVNFDVAGNDEIVDLKKRFPDKSIVGSGMGAILEDSREGLKKWIKVLGLDVNPINKEGYVKLIGIDALEEYHKTHPDIFAKIDIFRSSMETLKLETYEKTKADQTFEDLHLEFGPVFSKTIPFIVDKKIDSVVESGIDAFFAPGCDYFNKCFIGYEYNKGPNLVRVCDTDDMPDLIEETMSAFLPILEKMDYRGPLSTEEKITKDGKHYLLDWCSRLLAPGSSIYPWAIKNWQEFIYKVGKCEPCDMDIPYKYLGTLPLFSSKGEKKYNRVDIDPKYREQIRYASVCSDGKNFFAVKGQEKMAVCIAGADTWEEVLDKLRELWQYVDCDGKEESFVGELDNFEGVIKKGESCGIKFS